MNPKERLTLVSRCFGLVVVACALTLPGCSAIELQRQNATAAAAAGMPAAPSPDADPAATAQAEHEQLRLTTQALANRGTEAAATIAAREEAPTATAPPRLEPATSADAVVYARIPIDSDRLNSISALAFDSAGQLLVSTRAGEIYRLRDPDEAGALASPELIFADDFDQIGQVSGLLARGEALLLVNDGALSQLGDFDGDGRYESVAQLSTALPAGQSPLQADNSLVQAPDGRLFSADIASGEILQIVLRE